MVLWTINLTFLPVLAKAALTAPSTLSKLCEAAALTDAFSAATRVQRQNRKHFNNVIFLLNKMQTLNISPLKKAYSKKIADVFPLINKKLNFGIQDPDFGWFTGSDADSLFVISYLIGGWNSQELLNFENEIRTQIEAPGDLINITKKDRIDAEKIITEAGNNLVFRASALTFKLALYSPTSFVNRDDITTKIFESRAEINTCADISMATHYGFTRELHASNALIENMVVTWGDIWDENRTAISPLSTQAGKNEDQIYHERLESNLAGFANAFIKRQTALFPFSAPSNFKIDIPSYVLENFDPSYNAFVDIMLETKP